MLVYHADAEVEGVLGRANDDLAPVDVDLALVGVVDAGEHIHERGLAAAVLAEQGQDLALVDVEPHPVVGLDRAEGLGDVAHLHSCYFAVQGVSSFVMLL